MKIAIPVKLQPYAKAIAPFVGSLVAVGIQWSLTGTFDRPELVTALTGLGAAVLSFLVPAKGYASKGSGARKRTVRAR